MKEKETTIVESQWFPKFLKSHAWYCEGCKKFEITKCGFKPSWVDSDYGLRHLAWKPEIVKGQDFGDYYLCGYVRKTLAKF